MVDLIGAGRVGGALQARAAEAGVPVLLVTRTEGWAALAEGPAGRPVVVCTRNDDLADVVARVPAHRRDDLVFVQNGMIRPFLAQAGLAQATRGILFFAVPSRGAALDVGGASPFTGPRAQAVVDFLRRIGVDAQVVDGPAFADVELEKLVWNSAFGLLGQALGVTVGATCDHHEPLLRELVAELVMVGGPALGVDPDVDALLERLCAYSRSIPGWQGAVKEWGWRNGWFVDEAARRGVALPTHARLAREAGVG